jgi:hypothetical protein
VGFSLKQTCSLKLYHKVLLALPVGLCFHSRIALKPHPLTQVVLTPFAKEIPHNFSALGFEHAGSNFNSMIQKVRITNSESRFHCPSSFVARAVNKPSYSGLYQRTGTHHTGFNRGINDCVNDAIVTNRMRRFAQRHDFRVGRWILIRARSVPCHRQQCFTASDARTYRNFTAEARLMCCDKSLAHPIRVRFSFIGSSHDENILRQTTENLTIGVALKHCQASGYVGSVLI